MTATAPDRHRLPTAFALVLAMSSCATVPYTGRRQLAIVSEASQCELGATAYAAMQRRSRVASDHAARATVQDIGQRLAAVAERPDWQWEFTLFDDAKQVNAWALPGGKVGVYTGILPIAEDEDGLAAILGHEVAHVIARHSAERTGQGTLLGALGVGAGIAAAVGGFNANAVMELFGLGSDLGIVLPFSRSQESEADAIGLILAARAGYDPRAAVGLWERMAVAGGASSGGVDFFSTHPSHGSRIDRIRAALPRALTYYQGTAGESRRLPGVGEPSLAPAVERELATVMGRLDRMAVNQQGAEAVVFAIASEVEAAPETVMDLLANADLTAGEGALAFVLAPAAARPVDQLVASAASGGSWLVVAREAGVDLATILARLERIAFAAEAPGAKP